MSQFNCTRNGCKDVFNSFLVKDARYDGKSEIPIIEYESKLPNYLIPFSKALKTDNYNQWIHFYEDDCDFERVWKRPQRYLPILKRFNGIITPDFSLYRDMPFAMQEWNTYRGKALGHWWQVNGITVLPNVRWGDERTYNLCCYGVPSNGTICIGTHGCVKLRKDREYFKKGLKSVVAHLNPKCIIVYGFTPDDIFKPFKEQGILIIQFDSEYAKSRKEVIV